MGAWEVVFLFADMLLVYLVGGQWAGFLVVEFFIYTSLVFVLYWLLAPLFRPFRFVSYVVFRAIAFLYFASWIAIGALSVAVLSANRVLEELSPFILSDFTTNSLLDIWAISGAYFVAFADIVISSSFPVAAFWLNGSLRGAHFVAFGASVMW